MDSSGFGRLGEGLVAAYDMAAALLVVFIPLGIWKMIDIVLWFAHHLSVTGG